MKLIDSHAHLSSFDNIEQVLLKANKNKVKKIIAVSTNLTTSLKTLELSEKHPRIIYAALGIHPNQVEEAQPQKVLDLISSKIGKITAIGEIGLDYSRTKDMQVINKQQKIYRKLLGLAKENNITASIHSRMAHEDAYNMAAKYGPDKAVFHWFDGPSEILENILKENYFISVTPAIETSKKIQSLIKKTPLKRILIETDSPVYMRKYKRTAEPSDVTLTAKSLASLKGCSLEKVAEETSRNAEYIFDLNI